MERTKFLIAVIIFQTWVETALDEGYDQMIENMHNGKLKGTLLLNREDKRALFNF